ncbi:MAG: transcription-repair coupling factor [Armatimonadota bacterium]|nr:transcription-repair coupling factor [Armatimonadota bacterium]
MLQGLLAPLREAPGYNTVRRALADGAPVSILGPGETAAAFVLAAVATDPALALRAVLVVAPTDDAAGRLAGDLGTLLVGTGAAVHLYADASLIRERLAALDALTAGAGVVVASAAASCTPLLGPEALAAVTTRIRPGQTLPRDRLVAGLQAGGYERVGLVANPGEFAVRGGIIDLFPPDAPRPVRLELWGDEVDSLRGLDPLAQRSLEPLDEVVVRPVRLQPEGGGEPLPAYLPPDGLLALVEAPEAEAVARGLAERASRTGGPPMVGWPEMLGAAADRRRLAISTARPPAGDWREVRLPSVGVEAQGGQTHQLAQLLGALAADGLRVVIASAQAARVCGILRDAGVAITFTEEVALPPEAGRIIAVPIPLARGFRLEAAGLAVVTDAEIVGWRRRRPRMRFLRDGERVSSWTDLAPGDLVVHLHHGIGRYRGLVRLQVDGGEREYLLLEYAQGDRLYVPSDQIHLVQRYIGGEGEQPKIHRLGGAEWDREKRRVKEAAREMAASLLALYAARATVPGHAFAPDTPWQREMEAAFPYTETPHQRQAIEEVKRDMEAPRPMDRLVAGDVGYGKTEVALRAAFKAVMDGRQVAVVVPTTVLAQQHFNVFSERFARFPVTVELISRFRTPAEIKEVLSRTAAGLVDVLIGTHRILSRDVQFRNLGLVIIDEEQRFGVAHKEHLKALRKSVDVLTLTATPIPRTLHMSLAGIRDLTVMETPPEARLPIHTEIRPEDDEVIREAILRERARGGQVYVVHNRVETIERAARRIRRLVPDARVGVAHGQMPEERLEQVMLDFLGGRFDVLVCTTIVEIGLDIPQVNTIIIQDAHLLGLAQLYQLRGRVGRADRQAYCYLLYPSGVPLTPEAEQRLRAMAEFVELGSGLGLAMRDLEIRGAGNILGPEQHGHVAAVGFDLYCRLLDEAIRESRGEIVEEQRDPVLEVGVNALLPSAYIPDEHERIAWYRRLAAARTAEEVEVAAAELADQFGSHPPEVAALLDVVRLRIAARGAAVASITRQDGRYLIRFAEGAIPDGALQRTVRRVFGDRVQATASGLLVRPAGQGFADHAAALREVLGLVARVTARASGSPEAGGEPVRVG